MRREPSDEELEMLDELMAVYEFRKANGCPALGGPVPRAQCPGPHSPLCDALAPERSDADIDAAVSAGTAQLDEELDSL